MCSELLSAHSASLMKIGDQWPAFQELQVGQTGVMSSVSISRKANRADEGDILDGDAHLSVSRFLHAKKCICLCSHISFVIFTAR